MTEHHIYDCATGQLHVISDDDPAVHAAGVQRIEAESAAWLAEEAVRMDEIRRAAQEAAEQAALVTAERARRLESVLARLAKHPDPLLRELAQAL